MADIPKRERRAHLVGAALAAAMFFAASAAFAEVSEPSEHPDASFDFMNLLAHHGLHDLDDELWNAYGQLTGITQLKLPFSAAYSHVNGSNHSLSTDEEFSFTGTACGGIFLRALTIEGDADIVAPIFDCADKVGVPLILNEAKRITLPSRIEIAAGTLFRPRNDDSEGTLGAPS